MTRSSSDVTTIRVKRRTRDALTNIGWKRETHDDIIVRVMQDAGYDIDQLAEGNGISSIRLTDVCDDKTVANFEKK
jgi:hypothetical protein